MSGRHRKPWPNVFQTDEFTNDGAFDLMARHRANTRADQLAAICASPTALAHLQDVLSARAFGSEASVTGYFEDEVCGVPA